MNAKKIMGAVLVALLAAALFVGAGAAAVDYGNAFIYQDTKVVKTSNNLQLDEGVWTSGAATITVNSGVIIPSDNFVAGTYKKGDDKVYVTKPTATYSASADIEETYYLVANGGKVYSGSDLKVAVTPVVGALEGTNNVLVTFPNGTVLNITNPWNTAVKIEDEGTYKIQAIFAAKTFVQGASADLFLDAASFTFTVVEADDATISGSVDTVYAGEAVTFTAEGTPGETYYVAVNNFNISGQQLVILTKEKEVGATKNFSLVMPNTGKAVFVATVNTSATKEATLALKYNGEIVDNGEITVKISAPVVTATLGAASYYIGDEVEITGTATSEAALTFSIKGTNFDDLVLTKSNSDLDYTAAKEWEASFDTAKLVKSVSKMLDVGTYTITIKQADKVVASIPVALKQPFISLTSAPEVVVKGTDAEFIGTAEATNKVYFYVFGTNFFAADLVDGKDEWDGNKFTFTLEEEDTDKMATGQYFVVVQHPMYDTFFNIAPELDVNGNVTGAILLDTTANAVAGTASELFDVFDRQTANAAQALCDALDSQNIDDMYVKYAFILAGKDESFTVNEIPTEVVKGDKIVISGTATAYADEYVTVEMISTAFAAVPKETVGSASFITLSTKVAEDGTWEVTFDTSDLNVDEYSVKVACDGQEWKNVKVNVVEGADEPDTPDTPDVPDTPDTPDTPTEPETPGFGALAALAGLGAVAVLLLRRE